MILMKYQELLVPIDESSQEKDKSEVVSAEEQVISMVQEIEVAPGLHFEADGPKPAVKENSDVENEETVKVENTEELNSEKEIGPQDKAAVHNLDVTLEKFTELRLQTSYRRSVN
ncbi:uncharacterized protein LOC105168625 isoform X1 [Sesamum indicum]|uniref:Uncharacterized protein LOC105168625 isoform X1 n=1 Tax=Sesamum indicum TaxID=4182 RepID=A0A8M8UYI7_SESIN|nr:uncharacterized protein LOC105168625 isoform X1 [Sesamum indicum]